MNESEASLVQCGQLVERNRELKSRQETVYDVIPTQEKTKA